MNMWLHSMDVSSLYGCYLINIEKEKKLTLKEKSEPILLDILIKKGKFCKVLWIHILQYYPKLNNGHHTKPSNLYVC